MGQSYRPTDVRARVRREEAMVRGVRTAEGRGVGALAQDVRGVQRQGPASSKCQTMAPTMCGNLCVTWWGGTGTDVGARVRREEAMVRKVRTDERRGVVAVTG